MHPRKLYLLHRRISLGHRCRQGDEIGDERDGHQAHAASSPPGQRHHPGCGSEPVAVAGAAWDAAMGCPGSPVIGVGLAPVEREAALLALEVPAQSSERLRREPRLVPVSGVVDPDAHVAAREEERSLLG